jgi:hypothetical protein
MQTITTNVGVLWKKSLELSFCAQKKSQQMVQCAKTSFGYERHVNIFVSEAFT